MNCQCIRVLPGLHDWGCGAGPVQPCLRDRGILGGTRPCGLCRTELHRPCAFVLANRFWAAPSTHTPATPRRPNTPSKSHASSGTAAPRLLSTRPVPPCAGLRALSTPLTPQLRRLRATCSTAGAAAVLRTHHTPCPPPRLRLPLHTCTRSLRCCQLESHTGVTWTLPLHACKAATAALHKTQAAGSCPATETHTEQTVFVMHTKTLP